MGPFATSALDALLVATCDTLTRNEQGGTSPGGHVREGYDPDTSGVKCLLEPLLDSTVRPDRQQKKNADKQVVVAGFRLFYDKAVTLTEESRITNYVPPTGSPVVVSPSDVLEVVYLETAHNPTSDGLDHNEAVLGFVR